MFPARYGHMHVGGRWVCDPHAESGGAAETRPSLVLLILTLDMRHSCVGQVCNCGALMLRSRGGDLGAEQTNERNSDKWRFCMVA
jgi:hypothetical protein